MLVEKIKIDKKTDCWNWLGAKSYNGYGVMKIRKKTFRAMRYYYNLYRGVIPKQKVLDHLCKNVACVNPDHLEVVTVAENTRRGKSTKLDWEVITHIKRFYKLGLSQIEISKLFSITQGHVSRIISGERWLLKI